MGNTPVIFAPSHRSYADFILMAYVCFHYCIEIPCVAAGVGKLYAVVPCSHKIIVIDKCYSIVLEYRFPD